MNLVREVMDYITEQDPEVGKALELELGRQRRNLELIASENIVTPAVLLTMGTVPENKYAEGFPGKRYYGGCEYVDIVENLAIERAKQLFGCDHVCVQPHSGANANMAVYQALLQPGDTVMGLNLAHGGHLTHGSPVNMSGLLYHFVPYSVNDEGVLDYDEIRRLAKECKPKMIVAGASAYPWYFGILRFFIRFSSTPLTRIVPSVGSSSFSRSLISVDFPEPLSPTINTNSPLSM